MILLLYHSYGKGNVHNFRQYFFDELVRSGAIAHDIALRENRHERDFNTIVAKACGGVIPDVVILFTIRKCGEISGLENFKGLVVLYECDSENYGPKVIDYLNKYKNIRLATFEFYPEMSYPYEVEHKLWLPPTITAEDKMLGLERIYDFGHCGSYARYKGWHNSRIDFVLRVLPTIKSFQMEMRGDRLEEIGRVSKPLTSSEELAAFANQVKIMFACPTRYCWLTHQYIYPVANGCLVVGRRPQGFESQMVPESLVEVRDDFADLEEKVQYYLNNENERVARVQIAHDYVQKNHTTARRVQQLLEKIKEIA